MIVVIFLVIGVLVSTTASFVLGVPWLMPILGAVVHCGYRCQSSSSPYLAKTAIVCIGLNSFVCQNTQDLVFHKRYFSTTTHIHQQPQL